MENLVKRYFWVVNLLVLAALAYLSARVVNNIVAAEIVALPTYPAAPEKPKKKRSPTGMDKTQEWMLAISERNLFNSEPPDIEDEGGDEDAGPSRPEGMIPGEDEDCPKSEAKLGLVATMVAEPAEWSMAIVNEQETGSRLVREGQRIAERTIVAIYRERMVLAKGSGYECVQLGEKRGGVSRRGRLPGRSSYGSSSPPLARANYKNWIKKSGKNTYEIDRASLNEQLDDLSNLSRQARVIPHYRDGKPQGFKLVGVRPGSLYSHIGIRSGDVLKAIGDEEITSPNKALELYEKLKSMDSVAVEIERRGRKVTLEDTIK